MTLSKLPKYFCKCLKNDKTLIFFNIYIWLFCLHQCLCTTCVPSAGGRQKTVSGPLELELYRQLWASLWVLESNPGLLQEQPPSPLNHRATFLPIQNLYKQSEHKKSLQGQWWPWKVDFMRLKAIFMMSPIRSQILHLFSASGKNFFLVPHLCNLSSKRKLPSFRSAHVGPLGALVGGHAKQDGRGYWWMIMVCLSWKLLTLRRQSLDLMFYPPG